MASTTQSRRCPHCGCNNPETGRVCVGCGGKLASGAVSLTINPAARVSSAPPIAINRLEKPLEALGYASSGERFLAFICDASVQTLLVGALLGFFYDKSSLGFEALKTIATLLAPLAYMTLCEVLFHRTLGKWLVRIQVRVDSPGLEYPSFSKILIRESIGKFVSGLVLGIGFLGVLWNSKKQTWADHMANTVVVSTWHSSGLKALLIPILLITNAWLGIYLAEMPTRLWISVSNQLKTTETRIDDLHQQILLTLINSRQQSAKEYQRTVKILPSLLDDYDRLLTQEERLVAKGVKLPEGDVSFGEKQVTYEKVIRLRREITELIRQHVQMVLSFDLEKPTNGDFLKDREQMLKEVESRNNLINIIGNEVVRKKVSFQAVRPGNRE